MWKDPIIAQYILVSLHNVTSMNIKILVAMEGTIWNDSIYVS